MNYAELQPHPDTTEGLCCPKCQSLLLLEPDKINCQSCGFDGSVSQGILDLRCGRLDYYFNPVPRPEMKELVKPADREEWPRIIRSFMSAVRENPDWLDNLVVDGRYAWKLFLSLPEDASLLDLGCGLGNLVHNLAPQVDKVYALDLTWERLEFARLRCSLFNANDKITFIAGGDGTYLPFPDNSLDCVTLSGVLEWIPDDETLWATKGGKLAKALKMIAVFFGATNPRKIQIEFLKEIRRVLKPEGQLFIGIENRLNHEYFTGRPDHHSALKYGSLMPRFLANLYSIYKRRNPYRTYTYSLGGYRRLLRKAGYSQQRYLGLLDGYSKLKEILNIDLLEVPSKEVSRQGIKEKIKHHKMLVPAFGIIASQEKPESAPLISELIKAVSARLPDTHGKALSLEQLRVTGKDKAVITACNDNSSWVIKVPFTEYGKKAEVNGAEILTQLSSYSEFKEVIPVSVLRGEIRGLPYIVESKLPGESLCESLTANNREYYFEQVIRLWQRMIEAGDGVQQTMLDEQTLGKFVASDFEAIRAVTAYPEKMDLMLQYLNCKLAGCQVAVGLKHGDFSTHNILFDGSQNLRLIDWETAQTDGLVILDLINYLDSAQRALDDSLDIGQTVRLLLEQKWPSESERQGLTKAMSLCGFSYEEHLPAIALLYWMHHTREQLGVGMVFNNTQISQRIDEFLSCVPQIVDKET